MELETRDLTNHSQTKGVQLGTREKPSGWFCLQGRGSLFPEFSVGHPSRCDLSDVSMNHRLLSTLLLRMLSLVGALTQILPSIINFPGRSGHYFSFSVTGFAREEDEEKAFPAPPAPPAPCISVGFAFTEFNIRCLFSVGEI
jgi:hypothetical protein